MESEIYSNIYNVLDNSVAHGIYSSLIVGFFVKLRETLIWAFRIQEVQLNQLEPKDRSEIAQSLENVKFTRWILIGSVVMYLLFLFDHFILGNKFVVDFFIILLPMALIPYMLFTLRKHIRKVKQTTLT